MKSDLLSIAGIDEVVVDNFMKRNGLRKGYHCPKLVWMADTIANGLYRSDIPIRELFNHKKMVRPLDSSFGTNL